MAIPNVETTASRADYDVRTHKSNSKPHNAQAKPEQPSGGNPPKEDTVTISEEGKGLFELRKLSDEEKELVYLRFKGQDWEKQKAMLQESLDSIREERRAEFEKALIHKPYRENTYEDYVFNALEGKVEDAMKLAGEFRSMFFGDMNESTETRAMNREEGKMLAEYLSQNYFEDPEEAKAFMDTISKWAYKSEMRDKGYMFMNSVHCDMIWKERPDYVKMWANENGYGHLWDDNGHMKYDIDSKEYQSFRRAYDAAQMEYFYKNPQPYKEVMTVREYLSEVDPECLTSGESVNLLAGPGDLPWAYQERWQSWLEQFRSNEKAVQSVIDNAKVAIKGVSIEDLLAKHGSYI